MLEITSKKTSKKFNIQNCRVVIMVQGYIIKLAKLVVCGIVLSGFIGAAAWAEGTSSTSGQNFQMTTPEGIVIIRGTSQNGPSLTIRPGSATEINVTQLPNGSTLIRVPDGQYAMKPQYGMPYCVAGCDIAEDCNNSNHALRTGDQWTCENSKGFCRGVCVETPSKK